MTNEKTKWIFDDDDEEGVSSGGAMTEALDGDDGIDPTYVGGEEATAYVGGGSGAEKTQIYRGGASPSVEASGFAEDADPVTGWLVVVKGPGLGNAVQLGAGLNMIGRGTGARVALPFGDTLISSEDHLRIIYDDADRTFYVATGSGKNISRVNGQLLANTLPLESDATIELSKATTVVFKPFCSTAFDWSELADE